MISRRTTTFWTRPFRVAVFVLSATSFWCLLAEFYGLCSMRTFTLWISLPALFGLGVLAVVDRAWGTALLWRAVVIGALVGLSAAVSYDLFRVPFVYARELHVAGVVPPLPLFKVFPRFGAMILAQPVGSADFSPSAQAVGWLYHFSNGATFGIMYVALVGDPARRHWGWAVLLAVGLELGMLLTPYPAVFGIRTTATFVVVTAAAHLIFGVVLGLLAASAARRWRLTCPAAWAG